MVSFARRRKLVILSFCVLFSFIIPFLLTTHNSVVDVFTCQNCPACEKGSLLQNPPSYFCDTPLKPPSKLSICIRPNFNLSVLSDYHPELELGGLWRPSETCEVSNRDESVAIVIPYRNRHFHLLVLLNRLHTMLQRQNIFYQIFVADQLPGSKFNRGLMKNIGFHEAMKIKNFTCVYFHDVDLIPEDDRNIYNCPIGPRHHVTLLNVWNYSDCYTRLMGGVISLPSHHFKQINGFSNLYFNWGGEDDDLFLRMQHKSLIIENIENVKFGRYTMLDHSESVKNNDRYRLLMDSENRMHKDGLSSLKYSLKEIKKNLLFTHIKVRVSEKTIMSDYPHLRNEKPSFYQFMYWNWKFVDFGFIWNKITLRC